MPDDVLSNIDHSDNKRKPKIVFIIKKIKERPAHHGGAWKVAYADFVTAMMAFFLLLWILSSTSIETQVGLVEYFQTPNPSSSAQKGVGLPLQGLVADNSINSYTLRTSRFNPAVVPTRKSAIESKQMHTWQEEPSGMSSKKEIAVYKKIKLALEQTQSIVPNEHMPVSNIILTPISQGVRLDIIPPPHTHLFDNNVPTQHTKKTLALIGSFLAKLPYPVVVIVHGTKNNSTTPQETKWASVGLKSILIRHWFEIGGLPIDHLTKTIGMIDDNHTTLNPKQEAPRERISILIEVTPEQAIKLS